MKKYIFAIIFLLLPSLGLTGDDKINQNIITGFRNMKWNISPEEAVTIYPDFVFGWKSMSPNVIYKRTNEECMIGETNFDEIRYAFKDNKFNKVIAILEIKRHADLGPNVNQHFEKSPSQQFNKMKNTLESKYGPATQYKEEKGEMKYMEPLFMTRKKAEWIIGESRIVLDFMSGSKIALLEKNKGARGKNDMLSFSIEHVTTTNLGF